MEPTLTPVMEVEAIAVPGVISGRGIIHDLLNRIGEKLSRSCDLRASDAYSGYAAKVEITLQLLDVYPVESVTEVKVGEITPQLPSAHIGLSGEVVAEMMEPASLERPIDPDGVTSAPVKERRYYTPRGSVSLGSHARSESRVQCWDRE